MVPWVWIPVCLIVGGCIGIFLLALCKAAGKGDGNE